MDEKGTRHATVLAPTRNSGGMLGRQRGRGGVDEFGRVMQCESGLVAGPLHHAQTESSIQCLTLPEPLTDKDTPLAGAPPSPMPPPPRPPPPRQARSPQPNQRKLSPHLPPASCVAGHHATHARTHVYRRQPLKLNKYSTSTPTTSIACHRTR
uniref:Uncharacterized protein n=1 Tax=Oryza sativa subsp. japonica TaxID=39947 RepID=Q6EPP8_ORYSJ|nr:hypothetical protein [Oryza sativa Japonica Group]BAD29372.1 hypothetical protein [Oryza sativa Japonica Group]